MEEKVKVLKVVDVKEEKMDEEEDEKKTRLKKYRRRG